jgi:O-antigen ligase
MRPSTLKRSTALFAALPLLLLAAASFLTTPHRAHVAEALPDLAIGVAALVGWSLAIDRERLRRVLDAALVPAAALAAIAILQLHHLWQPVLFGEPLTDERMGITSLAGNPGDLAALLVLPCIVAQAGLPGARGAARWWRLVVLALCVYALAGTQTLTSLMAAVLGSVALWAVLLPRRYVLVGAAGAAVAVVLLVVLVQPLRSRVETLVRAATIGGGLNEVLTGRLDAWWVAERLLQEHPLAGVGFGAYRAEFAAAKLRLLSEGAPFFAGHLNPSFANAHNEYLEVGADLGWPGLLAMAWGIALVLRAAWRARRRLSPADRALSWGALVALALLALAYFPFRLGAVAFPALAFLAWLFANQSVEEIAP